MVQPMYFFTQHQTIVLDRGSRESEMVNWKNPPGSFVGIEGVKQGQQHAQRDRYEFDLGAQFPGDAWLTLTVFGRQVYRPPARRNPESGRAHS